MAGNEHFVKRKLHHDEIRVTPQQMQDETTYFENYRQFKEQSLDLLESRRKTFGFSRSDSSEMSNVKNCLTTLDNFLDTVISPEVGVFGNQLNQLQAIYLQMINHCSTYINTHQKPRTGTGKQRLQMVKLLYSQAIRESNGLATAASNIFNQANKEPILWANILRDARSVYIDANFDNISEVGNGTSEVYRFPVGNQTVYFKPLESVHEPNHAFYPAIEEYYQQSNDSSLDFAYNYIRTHDTSSGIIDTMKLYADKHHIKLSQITQDQLNAMLSSDELISLNDFIDKAPELRTIKEFLNFYRLVNIGNKAEGLAEVCRHAEIAPGQQISQRNVATTRIAKVLGINDMIAESRIAVVKWDERNKQEGIIMREAEGTDSLIIEQQGLGLMGEVQIDTEYSPEVLRQLTILSLFDSLCGQVDRNPSNILLKTQDHDGRRVITKASGIDNDTAFGNLKFENVKNKVKNTKKLVDADGLYALPCMDQEFFERIIALSREHVPYLLKDLIPDDNIDAFIERLEKIQELLLKTYEVRGKSFLIEKNGWDKASARFAALGKNLFQISYLAPEFIKTQTT